MKKKVVTALLAASLSVSMIVPAFATSGTVVPVADGTDVYAGIVLDDPDAKIKVEVPTLFAFVVNGATSGNDAISVANGSLLLPNVKVRVLDHSVNDGDYAIETVGSGVLKFTNYSTILDGAGRSGLEVDLRGAIKNEGTAQSRNYWEHVASVSAGDTNEFKQYNLEVNSKKFNAAQADGSLAMEDSIKLAAPEGGTNIDGTTKLAIVGKDLEAAFNVHIGGQRGQYTQVEESAKVGTIVWTVGVEIENTGGYLTAPSNPFLPETP